MKKEHKHIDPAQRERFLSMRRNDALQAVELEGLKRAIIDGDRYALSKAITLIEKAGSELDPMAMDLLDWADLQKPNSFRIAITGSPGVGKSSFIEALGKIMLSKKLRIAVLAIDPSSQLTHGSILGDKTRMETLSKEEDVFIRPSPAGTTLGGVARQTRNAISLCEAAGFDVVIVETVGVGQSETAVHSMVDLFILLLQPGEGDELQGIKKGIVELSDVLIINKADGTNQPLAKQTKADYRNALHYSGSHQKDWEPVIMTASALEGTGMEDVWIKIASFFAHFQKGQRRERLREKQNKYWFEAEFRSMLVHQLLGLPWLEELKKEYLNRVNNGEISSYKASRQFVEEILKRVKKNE